MAYTTVDDPEAHFQVLKYTGNGSAQSMTFGGTTNMQPDLVWIKNLQDAENHNWTDSVRGAEKVIFSNATNSQATETNGMSSFDSNGFGVSVTNGALNASDEPFISYCWKAGTTSGITTDGSTDITPSAYSFNQTSGFSIIQYAGDDTNSQVAHGLGAVPKMIITKQTDATRDWGVYHAGVNSGSSPEDYGLELSDTSAQNDDSGWLNDTAPDSVNITVGRDSRTNGHDGGTYIAYVFAEKQGFSKFGSYTGTGNVDGPFLYCGFQPAWCMIKRTDGAQPWEIFDNKRSTSGGFNEIDKSIAADNNNAEDTSTDYDDVDFVSNGIKIREDNDDINASGAKYIFVAFARAPFVNSNGVPCNAR